MEKFTLPIRFGVAISGSLIGYFLFLALLNYHTNPFFSLFNGVITGFGILEAIKYHKLEQGNNFEYQLQPLKDIHLHSYRVFFIGNNVFLYPICILEAYLVIMKKHLMLYIHF